MRETALSKPSSSPGHSSRSSNVEEHEVDEDSASSCGDSDDEGDTRIVVSGETPLPAIESVSVVNSNDVHIGNKTVYKGPVTIKQIVYPSSAISGDCVNNLAQCESKVTVKSVKLGAGVDNPSFENDCALPNKGKDGTDKDEGQDVNAQLTTTRIGKGFLWLKNLQKKHTRDIVILFSLLMVVVIILIIVIYGKRSPVLLDSANVGDTNELDNNTPVEYSSDSNSTISEVLRMIPRLQWLAQPPTHEAKALKTPVPLVIIQHTATESCVSTAQCIYHVRHIQQFHIESNHWWDIGYNFLIGGDGGAFEGRGWKYEGAHTLGYNYKSIGVAFIGTFSDHLPVKKQLATFFKLIAKGVELGYIQKDYKILGARQLYDTESPGVTFMREIETWPHWAKSP